MPSNEYALLIFMDILLLQKIVKINMPKISFSIVKNADINLKQWIYFLSIMLMLAKLEPEKKNVELQNLNNANHCKYS